MSIKFQLTGRIESFANVDGKFHTVITTPAADAYSKPNSFKVKSDYGLGGVGSEVTCDIELTGYVRAKPYEDRQTKQPKTFMEPNVFMQAQLAQPKAQAKSA